MTCTFMQERWLLLCSSPNVELANTNKILPNTTCGPNCSQIKELVKQVPTFLWFTLDAVKRPDSRHYAEVGSTGPAGRRTSNQMKKGAGSVVKKGHRKSSVNV